MSRNNHLGLTDSVVVVDAELIDESLLVRRRRRRRRLEVWWGVWPGVFPRGSGVAYWKA